MLKSEVVVFCRRQGRGDSKSRFWGQAIRIYLLYHLLSKGPKANKDFNFCAPVSSNVKKKIVLPLRAVNRTKGDHICVQHLEKG